MDTLHIIGIVIAMILFFGFFAFMCLFITLGILHDEDPERAEELIKRWHEQIFRNNNSI